MPAPQNPYDVDAQYDPDTTTPAVTKLIVVGGTSDQDFTFTRNPSKVSRHWVANYADSLAAGSDLGGGSDGPPPFEWVNNKPEDIHVEFTLHAVGKSTVDGDLEKLDGLRLKSSRTGEPPDLIFKMGPRSDRVRISDKNVDEILYTPGLGVQQAKVTLTLRTVRARQR